MKIKMQRFGDLLSSKTFLLFASFVLALTSWYFIVGNKNDEITRYFDAELFINPASQGLEANIPIKKIALTLSGSRRTIGSLNSRQVVCEVDIKGLGAGRHTRPVQTRVPPGVKVVQIAPATVEVTLARNIEKQLTVVVLPPDNMNKTYFMDGVVVTPKVVTASGREDELKNVFEAIAKPSLEQLKSGEPMKVSLISPTGVNYKFTPSEVTVEASYEKKQPEWEIVIKPLIKGALTPNLALQSVKVVPEKVLVRSDGKNSEQMTFEHLFTEPIDLSKIRDTAKIHARLEAVPPGITLLSSGFVDVTIEVQNFNSRKDFDNVPYTARGSDKKWTYEPQTVTVHVEGSEEVLKSLSFEDVKSSVYVDLTGVVTSTAILPVRVDSHKLPKLEFISVKPDLVRAFLTNQ